MKKEPSVWVIIVSWNGREHLPVCLESLKNLNYSNYEALVVDNGSTDGSNEYIREKHPWVKLQVLPENVGFCRGNNAGMERALKAGAEYVVLLNNDTEVHPDWLTHLTRAAEQDKSIGACSSRMLMFYTRNIINSTGVEMTWYGNGWDRNLGRQDRLEYRKRDIVTGVCGGAFFVRSEALRQAGLLPDDFDIYLEDMDLCLRLWDRGYKIIYVPEAIVYHKFSATMGEGANRLRKEFLNLRNRFWILLRNYPLKKMHTIAYKVFKCEMQKFDACRVHNNATASYVEWTALWELLKSVPALFKKRFKELREGRRTKFSQLIREDKGVDIHCELPEEPAVQAGKSPPRRRLMGISDEGLGKGWYRLRREGAFCRYIGKGAYLPIPDFPEGGILQVMVSNPFRNIRENKLHVYLNNKEIGSIEPSHEWKTYLLDLPSSLMEKDSGEDRVLGFKAENLYSPEETGMITDAAFRISEVSVLPKHSVFVRSPLSSEKKKVSSRILIGKDENGLLSGWHAYSRSDSSRWTDRKASFMLSLPDNRNAARMKLEISSLYPDLTQKLIVSTKGEEQVLSLRKGWREYEILWRNIESADGEFEIRAEPEFKANPHSQESLGVKVRKIEIEAYTDISGQPGAKAA